jgi:[acyl-carrier-protein] S-malonyltransferase
VLSNVTGALHANDGATIRQTMLRQVTEPVRWLSCVRAANTQTFIEFGPGKVLSGLIKRIDRQNTVANVQGLATLDSLAEVAKA